MRLVSNGGSSWCQHVTLESRCSNSELDCLRDRIWQRHPVLRRHAHMYAVFLLASAFSSFFFPSSPPARTDGAGVVAQLLPICLLLHITSGEEFTWNLPRLLQDSRSFEQRWGYAVMACSLSIKIKRTIFCGLCAWSVTLCSLNGGMCVLAHTQATFHCYLSHDSCHVAFVSSETFYSTGAKL